MAAQMGVKTQAGGHAILAARMYIRRIEIDNIRSIEKVAWRLPDKSFRGWNVVLGDNGAGKSSFLRSIALALLGPKEAVALRQDWNSWLRRGATSGSVLVDMVRDPKQDFFSRPGKTGSGYVAACIGFERNDRGVELVPYRTVLNSNKKKTLDPQRHIWGSGAGWFAASYGPFRRFSGGDKDAERGFLANPRLGAHLSVFGENVALNESLFWLRELKYKQLENHQDGKLLKHLKTFINQPGFLPYETRLKDVSSEGVEFEDANGFPVPVEELSDGYRSVLSMTFELIRQLSRFYPKTPIFGPDDLTIVVPGVVMIDEVDAHLHPTWQKRIGFWLTEHFPRVQFIVTTHSPLVCQAAEKGSIFLLPRPGSDDEGQMLEGAKRDRLVFGDILDAYSTEAFGTAETRSERANEMQQRLAILNNRELRKGLTTEERIEQQQLRATFPTTPHFTAATGSPDDPI